MNGSLLQKTAKTMAATMPRRALLESCSTILGDRHLALCLHRIHGAARATTWLPDMSAPATEIDRLLALLEQTRGAQGRLTVSFDDGYADAAEYVQSRAARHPEVAFRFFISPRKTELREGYAWDAREMKAEAAGLADHPAVRLATVDECRALARLPNVRLGNHTNRHLNLARLDGAETALEYRTSRADFERLFGPEDEVAIPFGTPGVELTEVNVAALRSEGARRIWSTEGRAFDGAEIEPGAVLPRFAVDGRLSAEETLARMALRTVAHRVRGSHRHFAVPATSRAVATAA